MLNTLRKSAGSLVAKLFFGVLVLSFAVWGIADVFRIHSPDTLASVGSTDISIDSYRQALHNQTQSLSARMKRPLTPSDVRALGLDQRVLGELVAQTALDEHAKNMGLGLTDDAVAKSVVTNPDFQDANGKFDATRFIEILRSNGLTEESFIAAQKQFLLRREVIEGLFGGTLAPQPLVEAFHRYQGEERNLSYVVFTGANAGEIAPPDDKALQTYYDEHKSDFGVPERRSLSLLEITPESLAKDQAVTEAEIAAQYEREKAKYTTPEKRTVQRIPFKTMDEAKAASDKIKAGASFEDIVKERGLSASDTDYGTVTKDQIVDKPIADAAFSLPQGQISDPVQGQFAPVLVRVTAIEPEVVRTLADEHDQIRDAIGRERARSSVFDLHDKIEDARAGGATLAEVAKQFKLTLTKIEGVDRQGKLENGTQVEIPNAQKVLAAAFESDVGVENDPVDLGNNGYVWFDVAKVDPARTRTFDEAKADVTKAWHDDAVRKAVAENAQKAVEELNKGSLTLEELAKRDNVEVQTAINVGRGGTPELGRAATNIAFATPADRFASAEAPDAQDRIILQVRSSTVPPLKNNAPEAQQVAEQLGEILQTDLADQYVMNLQSQIGVTVNQRALANVLGEQPQQ